MPYSRFFEKRGPFPFEDIIRTIGCTEDFSSFKSLEVFGIDSLINAEKNEITFLSSNKYTNISFKTKAAACITSLNLSKFLPESCIKINVKNILLAVTKVSKMFYPEADLDYLDVNLTDSKELKEKYPNVSFGKNVLIGKNVEIGKNTFIADRVCIQDGSKIGIKGFGFIPIPDKNLRAPHVGKVILEEGVEVGANSTIDRGSLSDTVIGQNTFIDNQVHVAHNVKIGKNCMIAGQVGFAGSVILGDNVVIGGQSGVSGHLKIGNNVKIGGGSGVIQNIADNSQVMGYPAIPLKEFVKQRKK